ncbi:LOW QUALITY PROTEIN: aromatic-L-amino-acid decarboxylase-like [Ptychodera flava]|uniref:LOW QUALITY PROTEIN: aromatic-L-amino-acid decarboxylase-like n=1 Tax=Ptychodera flava TaxID=63121 RepID=UPI00396A29F7
MNSTEFRKRGSDMVDYIANYMDTIGSRRVFPDVQPGYLRKLLPTHAPRRGEKWESIFADIERTIMPGITHWQHPRFHAYFPAGNSYPSILGDMLSDAIGCVGFSWAASPACTELETIIMDWFGKMINLPKQLLPFTEGGKGGGVIQGSASECILVCLLSAREKAMHELRDRYPGEVDGVLVSKLVAYCSKQAHSAVEKAGKIAFVKMRQLDTDNKFSLRGETLETAIKEDIEKGLYPCFVSATFGTTASCGIDNIKELGSVCRHHDLWLHVDAAYAGSALVCPEFRSLIDGIEDVTSFNMNPNKWMLVNFDCSLMWVKDKTLLIEAFNVDPVYLRHENEGVAIDYRHWGIPLSRRFRSLKLWFVVRYYGIEGLRKYIRKHVKLAKKFESLVYTDDRFEVVGDVIFGLVCFRLKGNNTLTEQLLKMVNDSGKLHMVPASLDGKYVIRFAVCAEDACDEDIFYAWSVIVGLANELLHFNGVTSYVSDGDQLPPVMPIGKSSFSQTQHSISAVQKMFPWKRKLANLSCLGSHLDSCAFSSRKAFVRILTL